MAKGIYVGVGGAAKKVKKIYVGVNGVPKKVKKTYVGVNGVPKLVYSAEFSYNVTTANDSNQLYLNRASSDTHAIFNGGGYEVAKSHAIDSNFVLLTIDQRARLGTSGAFNGKYTVFGDGGISYSSGSDSMRYANQGSAYNSSLVHTLIENWQYSDHRSARAGNYTLIAGGSRWGGTSSSDIAYSRVNMFDQNLTNTTATDLTNKKDGGGSATVNGKALFIGGRYSAVKFADAYNETGVKIPISSPVYDVTGYDTQGASVGDSLGVFKGTLGMNLYDRNLVLTSFPQTNHNTRCDVGLDDCVLLIGDYGNAVQNTNTMSYIDSSGVINAMTPLPFNIWTGSNKISGARCGTGKAAILGNMYDRYRWSLELV